MTLREGWRTHEYDTEQRDSCLILPKIWYHWITQCHFEKTSTSECQGTKFITVHQLNSACIVNVKSHKSCGSKTDKLSYFEGADVAAQDWVHVQNRNVQKVTTISYEEDFRHILVLGLIKVASRHLVTQSVPFGSTAGSAEPSRILAPW